MQYMPTSKQMAHLGCKNVCKVRAKKKLFGCPPLPALSLKELEKSFYCTKVYASNFQNFRKSFLFSSFADFDLLKIFSKFLLSTCLHFKTGLQLVRRDFFCKVNLFTPSLGDTKTITPCGSTLI